MNFFEDLVDELKEENLLEETVIEIKKAENNFSASKNGAGLLEIENFAATESFLNSSGHSSPVDSPSADLTDEKSAGETKKDCEAYEFAGNHEDLPDKKITEKEFYRKRAVEEVSYLQMVEHVISGVEREQMKALPQIYDDLEVKKTLHAFLQITEDAQSPAHTQAEFLLMQETENWCSALSYRDRRISIAHLRRYCETTKPPLSSQALISLARFYRNLPFSESVRNKFDLVITRLFSKDVGGDKRLLVFSRQELSGHLNELYAEWSSIQFHTNDDNSAEIKTTVQNFDAFIKEAEAAKTFDSLIETQFFTRLRDYKDTTHELFFAPLVAAAAVECNIRIGNKYVDLIEREREREQPDAENLQDKYGFLHDQAISDATSKTLQLVELLKEKEAELVETAPAAKNQEQEQKPEKAQPTEPREPFFTLVGVNRWLLAATILVAVVCGGLYYWANYSASDVNVSDNVQKVDLENSPFAAYFKTARITNRVYFAEVLPEWEKMPVEKRKQLLGGLLTEGKAKSYSKVLLLDKSGNSAGQADAEKVEVADQ